MRTFSDGRNQWAIEITVGSIRRVMADTTINLSLPHEQGENGQSLAEKLVFDVITQVDVLWSIVRPQAEKISISMEQFLELVKPEILKTALEAFHEEWKDFFRKLGQTVQLQIVEQAIEYRDAMQKAGAQQMERMGKARTEFISQQMEKEVDLVLNEIKQFGSTPGQISGSVSESLDDSESTTSIDSPGVN